MKLSIVVIPSTLCALLLLAAPQPAAAQTFVPQTEREQQAYLYGQLLYLTQLLDALEELQRLQERSGIADSIELETRRANNIEATYATLRGEVVVPPGERVDAWFEYDEDDDFLGNKTRKVRVDEAYDRAVSQVVRNLEEDERYYYRIVVQDSDGGVQYGNVSQFRTDEED